MKLLTIIVFIAAFIFSNGWINDFLFADELTEVVDLMDGESSEEEEKKEEKEFLYYLLCINSSETSKNLIGVFIPSKKYYTPHLNIVTPPPEFVL